MAGACGTVSGVERRHSNSRGRAYGEERARARRRGGGRTVRSFALIYTLRSCAPPGTARRRPLTRGGPAPTAEARAECPSPAPTLRRAPYTTRCLGRQSLRRTCPAGHRAQRARPSSPGSRPPRHPAGRSAASPASPEPLAVSRLSRTSSGSCRCCRSTFSWWARRPSESAPRCTCHMRRQGGWVDAPPSPRETPPPRTPARLRRPRPTARPGGPAYGISAHSVFIERHLGHLRMPSCCTLPV